jgi:hypothetical protein
LPFAVGFCASPYCDGSHGSNGIGLLRCIFFSESSIVTSSLKSAASRNCMIYSATSRNAIGDVDMTGKEASRKENYTANAPWN